MIKNILLALDQLANVLILGSPDETISARSYRMHAAGSKGWGYVRAFVDALFWFEPDHTRQAYFAEKARCHMPVEYQSDGLCEVKTDDEKGP